MKKSCTVYGLYSTTDMEIRYIGQTRSALQKRLKLHFAEALRPPGTSPCHRWIRETLESGQVIDIRPIETNCCWDEAERKWIAYYCEKYPGQILNVSDGGTYGSPGRRPMETRMKMRKPKSEAHKAKMRKPKSAETKKKMSLAQMGNRKGVGEANGVAVLTTEKVIDIKERLRRRESLSSIGAIHGVTKGTIWKIKAGYSWTHVSL